MILLLLTFLPFITNADLKSDCYLPGECLNSLIASVSIVDTAAQCKAFCLSIPDCSHFTFYHQASTDDGECIAFKNCVNFSNSSCSECFSGERNCSEASCWFEGRCEGTFLQLERVESANDCLGFCAENADCEWFTFNRVDNTCLLTSTCEEVDEGCVSCLSGENGCQELQEYTKLFVVSGDPDATKDAEVVDLTSIHSQCQKPTDFPVNVEGAVGFVYEGSVTSCGGSGPTDECYRYNRASRTWERTVSLGVPRYQAVAVEIGYNEVWIMGGEDENDRPMSTSEILSDHVLSAGPSLPEPMARFCAVKINSTHLFVASGRSFNPSNLTIHISPNSYLQNLRTMEWTVLPARNEARYAQVCGHFENSDGETEVVVGGGRETNTVEILNLSSLTWRSGPSFEHEVAYARSVQFEKDFLAAGGAMGSVRLNSIYHFDAGELWRLKAQTLKFARDSCVVVAVQDEWAGCSGVDNGTKLE